MRLFKLLIVFIVAAVRTWWTFRKEHGVEADDLGKEREPQDRAK